MEHKINQKLELLIDLLEGCLEEEGYKISRDLETTAYDTFVVEDKDGKIADIHIVGYSRMENPFK